MKSFAKRILTSLIGVPAIFVLIFCFPQLNHLAFAILVYTASLLGSYEMKGMMELKEETCTKCPFWVPSLLIVAAWVETFYPTLPLTDLVLLFLAIILFSLELFSSEKDGFVHSLSHTASSALLLLYPSFFFTFLVKVSIMEHNTYLLLLYFLLVFGNDTSAYLFGMAFGKNNRGFLKVSPNKSIAGFIGATVMSIILSAVYCHYLTTGFGLWQSMLLGFFVSLAANIGDLIESSFKRSVCVKDSGKLIPGRGGLLDSIDSLLAAAPIFWVLAASLTK